MNDDNKLAEAIDAYNAAVNLRDRFPKNSTVPYKVKATFERFIKELAKCA